MQNIEYPINPHEVGTALRVVMERIRNMNEKERKRIMARYKFYHAGNMVICVSSYAKKKVVGKAKCAPGDEFDLEKGKRLAQLRCDLKVAQKRRKKAEADYMESWHRLMDEFKKNNKMISYYDDAKNIEYEAANALKAFRDSI